MHYLDREPRTFVQAWQAPPVTEATGPLLEAGRALVRALAEPLPGCDCDTVWEALKEWSARTGPPGDAFLREVGWRHDLFLVDGYCLRVVYDKLARAEAVAVYPRSSPLTLKEKACEPRVAAQA